MHLKTTDLPFFFVPSFYEGIFNKMLFKTVTPFGLTNNEEKKKE
jgi:hypothetical protein